MRFVPPLTITQEEMQQGLLRFRNALLAFKANHKSAA
jgi:acetylornithine/succinyldiaminopimelate/putrescine aminotransferase